MFHIIITANVGNSLNICPPELNICSRIIIIIIVVIRIYKNSLIQRVISPHGVDSRSSRSHHRYLRKSRISIASLSYRRLIHVKKKTKVHALAGMMQWTPGADKINPFCARSKWTVYIACSAILYNYWTALLVWFVGQSAKKDKNLQRDRHQSKTHLSGRPQFPIHI